MSHAIGRVLVDDVELYRAEGDFPVVQQLCMGFYLGRPALAAMMKIVYEGGE